MPHPIRACLAGVAVLLVTLMAFPPAQTAYAQSERCFAETGHCISGRFRQFWEENGGLPVFGFPITVAGNEVNRDTGQPI